jgi:hypothetical protein
MGLVMQTRPNFQRLVTENGQRAISRAFDGISECCCAMAAMVVRGDSANEEIDRMLFRAEEAFVDVAGIVGMLRAALLGEIGGAA